MTQDEIIEMAQECNLIGMRPHLDGIYSESLVAFANLVAAKEREALAQTQEPVAWIHNFIDGGISIGKRPADLNRHPDRWTALYKDPTPCQTCQALARTVMLDQTSHDTAPLKRTWVGLTDDEYFALQMKIKAPMISVQDYIDAMRMVEAKLKEKNT